MNITADMIKDLIVDKCGDKAIPIVECNTGSAYMHNIRKFDVWVMEKSWSPFRTIGYEVKVNRNDFLKDSKWSDYLPYCNQFYFITTGEDIINANELPNEVGLKYVSKNCKMIYTKKRAIYRKIDIPTSIFAYIMMWRVRKVDTFNKKDFSVKETFEERKQRLDRWLKEKEYKHEYGLKLRKKISEKINKSILETQEENKQLKKENEKLKMVKKFCESIDLKMHDYYFKDDWSNYYYKKQLENIKNKAGIEFIEFLNNIIKDSTNIKNVIECSIKGKTT